MDVVTVSGPSIGQGSVDSARQNLAASFVSGMVNAAFGKDKLLTEDGNTWLYKNKEHGQCVSLAFLLHYLDQACIIEQTYFSSYVQIYTVIQL